MSDTLIIAQGGGPTAVINQTMAGAVIEARKRNPNLRILGARHGVSGLVRGDTVDLTPVSDDELLRIAALPAAALGSTRDKPDAEYCERILDALKGLNTRAFLYIGGNDTSGTLDILKNASGDSGINFIHAPKTIDNDLEENDHTPGFISAGWFVATAFKSVDHDFRSLPGIYAAVVMGRHAGFLTAASGAWSRDESEGPHLIYGPEIPFTVEQLLADIEDVRARHGRCIIAISEGIQDADGVPLAEILSSGGKLERDPHGNVQLSGSDLGPALQRALKDNLPGVRSRVDTLGYMPRYFMGCIAETDAREAFEVGKLAAITAAEESASIAVKFDGEKTVLKTVPLDAVAAKTRHMPRTFYNEAGNNLSDEGRAYLKRLIPAAPDLARPFV